MGAGLLAEAVYPLANLSTDRLHSRASQLPLKPAPTFDLRSVWPCVNSATHRPCGWIANKTGNTLQLWELACLRRRCLSWQICRLTDCIREQARSHSSQLPPLICGVCGRA